MAKKPAAPEAPVSMFECVSPIEHDGERIDVGDVVEFPADIADPLVAAGALRAPVDAAPADQGAQGEQQGETTPQA